MLYTINMAEDDWIDSGINADELMSIPKSEDQRPEPEDPEEEEERHGGYETEDSTREVKASSDDEVDNTNQTGRDIMSKFFDFWDEDQSGTLDIDEVLAGVERCCDAMNLDYDSRKVSALFDELDTDGNQELDRKEFTVFLQIYAAQNDIGMEDLAFVMADHLSQFENDPKVTSKQSNAVNNWFKTLFSAASAQVKQRKEYTQSVDSKPANSQNVGGRFFNWFAQKPILKKDAPECMDVTTDEVSDDKLTYERPKEDIEEMMWDIPTIENSGDVTDSDPRQNGV
jgi:hypothetical protein